jgi:RimJ/RimL family protein N-acetyltransferase
MKNMFLEGNRIYLRLHTAEDAEAMYQIVSEPNSWINIGRHKPITLQEEIQWLQNINKKANNLTFAIVLKQDDTLIGNTSLRYDLKHRNGTTGTLIQTKHTGKGYGTEAKMLMLWYAFNTLGLGRVYSEIAGHNTASQTYAKKCGYTQEAELKNNIFEKGAWWSRLFFTATKKSWLKKFKPYKKQHFKELLWL